MTTAIQGKPQPTFGQSTGCRPARNNLQPPADSVQFGQAGEKKRTPPALVAALAMLLTAFVPQTASAQPTSPAKANSEVTRPATDYHRLFAMNDKGLMGEGRILAERFEEVARQGIQDLRDRYAELNRTYEPMPQPVLGYESDGKPIDISEFPPGTFPGTTEDVKPRIIQGALERMDAILERYDADGNIHIAYCDARMVTAFHNMGDESLLNRLDQLANDLNTIDFEGEVTIFLLENSEKRTPNGQFPTGIRNAVEEAAGNWAIGCTL